jgi:hypothetical protein
MSPRLMERVSSLQNVGEGVVDTFSKLIEPKVMVVLGM